MGADRDDIGTLPTVVERPGDAADALYGPDLGAGAQIGSYVVESRAVRGGFATVYRARHFRGEGGPRAVKVLHQALMHSPSMVKRFKQEADVIRRLEHPSIVELEDYGELIDGRPYFVMPWLFGTTLAELLDARGAVSVGEAVSIVGELCSALAVAHAEGVVHRDVKPSNILVVENDLRNVMLLDFGIAKLAGDGNRGRHDLTTSGIRIGTPHYMAPEQILGKPVDGRTDIYALGVCLYQLLTGELPFRAPTPVEIEEQHLNAPPPRPSAIAPIPAALDEVIERCLAKAPERRYATVDALAADLRAALADPGGEARSGERAAPRSEQVLALHIAAPEGARDVDDETVEALEDLLAASLERCEADGFDITIDSGASFLAVLPVAGHDPVARQRLAVGTALAIAELGCDAGLSVSAVLHLAEAEISERGGERRYVGGELLRLGDWLPDHQEPRVLATPPALSGIERELDLADAAAEGRIAYCVVRRRIA